METPVRVNHFNPSIKRNHLIKLIFSFSLFFLVNSSFSQTRLCSEYEVNKRAERENPDALKAKAELESFTKQFIQNNQKSDETYIIPVVFHVLHNYGSENISKAQILDAVRILNEDFRKLNPDTSDIIPAFQGIAANSKLEFRLAKIDPSGNCTDGIVRVATGSTYNADDDAKNQSPAWPRNKYLNIWTCNSIGSGAAGYSYYPSNVSGPWGASIDGVIIISSYVGSIGTGNYNTGRALTHEIGHYLNLPHTWGSSNQPGLASNCDIDDGISDTPNTIGHTSCNLSANTCGQLDNVQNFMDYSYCSNMYTEGQKARMRAALNSTVSNRNSLWSASNTIATGTNDGYVAQVCIPEPDFTFDKSLACDNITVQFSQLVWNIDSGYTVQWSFPGASPSVSTDINPLVTYSVAGTYSATLTATSISGSNQITKSNIIQVQNPTVGEELPWLESFENTSFPVNNANSDKSWMIRGNSTSNWSRVSGIAYTGTASLRVANASNNAGQTSELYSPNIVFAGNNPGNSLTFRVAYAQKTADDNDRLQVYFSNNCGQTWYPRLSRIGSALATNGGALVSSFTPNATQWRLETIALSTLFTTKPNFRVKFLVTSGNGNSVFIEDINLVSTTTGISEIPVSDNLEIFPNPVTDQSILMLDLNKASMVNFTLLNILGQKTATLNKYLDAGSNDLLLNDIINTDLKAGIYFLHVKINENNQILKLLRQ